MTRLLQRILASTATLLVVAHAHGCEAGWMQIQTPGPTPGAPTTTVALFYPTMAAPRAIAIGGKPVDQGKALILLSHGISGTETGTASWSRPWRATAMWSPRSVIPATTGWITP